VAALPSKPTNSFAAHHDWRISLGCQTFASSVHCGR
jgi:hypothetical protein